MLMSQKFGATHLLSWGLMYVLNNVITSLRHDKDKKNKAFGNKAFVIFK